MATICQHHVTACMASAARRQISQRALLERAGINPQLLQRRDQRFHTDQVARLFKCVQDSLDDEFMGFTESPCRVGLFATMTDLVSRCATLGELLERAIRFYNLVNCDIVMHLSRHTQQASVSFTMRRPELDSQHFMAEWWLVIWHRFPSWYIGEPIRLQETHFTFAAPAHRDELSVMFPAQLQFNCAANQLIFDAYYLDMPLRRNAQQLRDYLANMPVDLMTIPGSADTLESQIERHISQRHPGRLEFFSLQDMAALLGISAQTLHRRLAASDTSYQKIKDNLRREMAIRQLTEQRMTVEQVAERVGYSESRSFTRAFRHWTGVTPREYRKQRSTGN
ncbi:MAG: AraC family transcriptional regulator [Porticoccaceae bacterium]|nr:AraC family transcriptional regulator [Porticoccaceae bacterium]